MGFIQRRILKSVMVVVAWPKVTLVLAGLVLGLCLLLAGTKLGISTDQNKLFSRERVFFRDYTDFIEKFPENEAVYVVVEARAGTPSPPRLERWTGIADGIAAKLRTMPKHVRLVQEKVPLDQLGIRGVLFQSNHEMQQSIQGLEELGRVWGTDPSVAEQFVLTGRTPLERFLQGVNSKMVLAPDPQAATFAGRLAERCTEALAPGKNSTQPTTQLVPGETLELAKLGAMTPLDLGYSYVPDESDPTHQRHLLLVAVYHQADFKSGLTAISETIEAIRQGVAEVARGYPEFQVGVTGRPALDADEMRTTDRDTKVAELIAMSVIFVGLVLMLRSVWLALVAEISLAIGIGWTLGWATISVGELNLLSLVFVIALIGIGMDYLIQILTRYRREAQRYVRQQAIWARVFRYVSPPILTACLGAAGAFLVSTLTDFRGAGELGLIAGGGLLLCLLAGYTVMPALLVLWPAKLQPVPAEKRYATRKRTSAKRKVLRWVMPVAWVTLCAAGIPYMLRTNFDPNLLNLQSPRLESVQLVKKLQTWYGVVLSEDLEQLRAVRKSLVGAKTVKNTDSILEALDNTAWLGQHPDFVTKLNWTAKPRVTEADVLRLQQITERLAQTLRQVMLATKEDSAKVSYQQASQALTALTERLKSGAANADERMALAAALQDWQQHFVGRVQQAVNQLPPEAVEIAQLPASMREHYVSENSPSHKRIYALYVYPKENLWNREPLAAFVTEVERCVAAVPALAGQEPLRLTGIASNIYHSTAAIEHAFYLATGYALGLICILVLIDLRNIRQTLLAISVLALGLPMLVALMGLFGISWNFANFFGLPILIGAGHEYGVFMVHRYREVLHNPRRIWHGWDVSDRALLLCAFVTSSSFAFLMLGQHRGIRSLGLVMALGSACIYLATVLVVRPLLIWRLEGKGSK